MITDRNKLNFVTIQWLWFLCLILLASFNGSNTWMHYAEATQHQQQQQLKSTLQLQPEDKTNGPQQQKQQDATVRNFSPRVDYNNNEWRPVGRGDPLKNDPTFDYSPPTLDRVKYWADSEKDKEKLDEVSDALIDSKLKKANPGKNEILLLGVTGDRMRGGAPFQQHGGNIVKNAKGETPLLQPKYTSIRRSYYAHQLPTHLMPPPMQPMASAPNMQSSHQQQQVQAMHIVKPALTEYRHNMPGQAFMTSPPMASKGAHSSPHYMSTATQPWMHPSNSPSMGTSVLSSSHPPLMMSGNSHRYSHPHVHTIDSHQQESVNYFSYHNRPSLTSTPSIMLGMNGGMAHHEIYSPNSIRSSFNGHKMTSSSSRKPWIHDLLQKEFIKPLKPTHYPNPRYGDTIKSTHPEPQTFEPAVRPQGITTTHAPVTFIAPTIPSTTSTPLSAIYITTTTQKQSTSTSPSPMYSTTTPTYTTHTPRTTSTLSPTRLLIPNTSNLAYRPTVAPLKMTTDSLFSHYNQPEEPIRGPMYLIIEGHSKVKTYGKDELDPHKPKIVPIIPKREPVVRMADPNEKRGTPETFQVKHLHTKPTVQTTTTVKPPQSSTPTTSATKKPMELKKTTPNSITSTSKPKTVAFKVSTTQKPTGKKLTSTSTTIPSPTTTTKPTTSKSASKVSESMVPTKPSNKDLKDANKNKTKSSMADLKVATKISSSPNALDTMKKPHLQNSLVNEPPTGMQGLLSFLDSSLSNIFKEDPGEEDIDLKATTTKLKLMPAKAISSQPHQQESEARISSTKLEPIKAEDYEYYANDDHFKMTTENLPRETRQIFDYDQLPESRINLNKDDTILGAFLDRIDDEDDLSAFNLGDEYEEDEDEEEAEGQAEQSTSNVNSSKLKPNRIQGDDFDDISSLIDDDLPDIDEEEEESLANMARKQQEEPPQRQKEIMKA